MSESGIIDLLVVDDDSDFRRSVVQRFRNQNFHIVEASDGNEALTLIQRRDFDVAVVDMMMPEMSGLELLEKMRALHAECEVIILTGQATVETAVAAMKLGAYDYLTKPFPLKELERLVQKACERRRLAKENCRLRTLLERTESHTEMVGESAVMQEVFRLIERAGPSDKAILIQGESGTGKELVARALHRCSARHDQPMVVINCAALPETLLESELFGHERGAFTGALNTKPGLFEVADGGTLFIDEIGEMPGSLQAKLLRVLEDGTLRRIGSIKERRVNVRLLAATNRDMAKEVAASRFREDLFYRINVLSLKLPPLRERVGDIPLLIAHFLGKDWKIEPEAMAVLERYHWPGNIRQLSNALERAKIMADDQTIRLGDLPHDLVEERKSLAQAIDSPTDDLASIERTKVVEVLGRVHGNKTRAARALGIDRRKLYRLVDKYKVTAGEYLEPAKSVE